MVAMPNHEFVMGVSPHDKFANDTERPAHRVVFAHPWAISRYPVTVADFRKFRPDHGPGEKEMLPAVLLNCEDAIAFCQWLAVRTSRAYRLPSEAEWEFACRAGVDRPFSTGDVLTPQQANYFYAESGERVGTGRRTPVGSYPPNAYGLYDMQGNICEWTADSWHPNYHGAPVDGSSWTESGDATQRVIRGGAWDYMPRLLRSSWRDVFSFHSKRDNLGFRIAETLHSHDSTSQK